MGKVVLVIGCVVLGIVMAAAAGPYGLVGWAVGLLIVRAVYVAETKTSEQKEVLRTHLLTQPESDERPCKQCRTRLRIDSPHLLVCPKCLAERKI